MATSIPPPTFMTLSAPILDGLPVELLRQIIGYISSESQLSALSKQSRRLHQIVLEDLYSSFHCDGSGSRKTLSLFVKTLAARPDLSHLLKTIEVNLVDACVPDEIMSILNWRTSGLRHLCKRLSRLTLRFDRRSQQRAVMIDGRIFSLPLLRSVKLKYVHITGRCKPRSSHITELTLLDIPFRCWYSIASQKPPDWDRIFGMFANLKYLRMEWERSNWSHMFLQLPVFDLSVLSQQFETLESLLLMSNKPSSQVNPIHPEIVFRNLYAIQRFRKLNHWICDIAMMQDHTSSIASANALPSTPY